MSYEAFALVVGGSGGIGAACARKMAADGHRVVVTYNGNRDKAESLVHGICAKGGRAEHRQLSLPDGDPGDLRGLEHLIFAAGADIAQPYISKADPGELKQAIDIELHGFFALVKRALPELRLRDQASIVALSSAGLGRFPVGDILSVAPKAAVQAVVRGLAREEGRYGLRANAVAVGVVEAGIFERIDWDGDWIAAAKKNIPLRRFAHADEIANVVAFLASPAASYVTGQTIYVDGGYSV